MLRDRAKCDADWGGSSGCWPPSYVDRPEDPGPGEGGASPQNTTVTSSRRRAAGLRVGGADPSEQAPRQARIKGAPSAGRLRAAQGRPRSGRALPTRLSPTLPEGVRSGQVVRKIATCEAVRAARPWARRVTVT